MQTDELQKLLFAVMPQWYRYIAKPFKQLMRSGVSLDMYYCIQILRYSDRNLTMTELAKCMRVPKQQMTKLCNKLIEQRFVERLADPDDRRVVRLAPTERAEAFTAHFLTEDAAYYKTLFESLDDADRENFRDALGNLFEIFMKLDREECRPDEQKEG